ncbi:phosphate acetyltransferase [Halolamina litorea]|uniref:Phosphate acyltransferase n=1 Tax=Halolamina litorea TaxID=1515593 RepID=A0ABD6BUK4_9EURY|nr:phosphate acyltransferase [Halolamina litorea]
MSETEPQAERSVLDGFAERVSGQGTRLVFPEGEDERVLRAAAALHDRGLALPTVLGDADAIHATAEAEGIALSGVEVIDPTTAANREGYAAAYGEIRGVSMETALKIVGNELFFGGLAVRTGDADGLVGGCVRTSGELIAAGKEVIGLKPDVSVPSSFFVMAAPDGGVLVFADAALNANPTAEELADIAVTTGESAATLLGWESRVAMLSFSTKGSADHPDVTKVRQATEIARDRTDNGYVDGELQADAALNPEIAARKLDDIGPVSGRANTLVFPDLDAGNIGYKLTQELAGASAYGPVLQGFAAPISDLSRGASVDDIVGAATITAALAVGDQA